MRVMEQLRLTAPGELVLEPQPDWSPGPGEVVVEVVVAGICGSDVHGYRGVNRRRRSGTVMGHEVSGIVRTLGPGVPPSWADRSVVVNPVLGCGACTRCRAGQPQLCPDKALIGCVPEHPGGFATTLRAPVTALVPWSGPAPLTWGPLAEPRAVAIEAADRTPLAGREVLVLGSGPVAVAGAWAAQRRGATVTVTETEPGRRDLLRALGLPTLPFGAEPRRTPDAVLDCVAVDDSLAYALQHVAPGGDVVVVGLGAALAALPVERLVQGALGLLGSAQYTPATFADAAAWAASGRLDLEPLLGLPRPLSEGPALFAQWDDDPDRPLRTLLTPG